MMKNKTLLMIALKSKKKKEKNIWEENKNHKNLVKE